MPPSQGTKFALSVLTSPYRIGSGGIATDRKQADLKPLLQLEVSGLVFEDAIVPHIFFPQKNSLAKFVPSKDEADPFIQKLQADLMGSEDDAYDPLKDLLEFIVNYGESVPEDRSSNKPGAQKNTAAPPLSRPRTRIRFRVYDRQMADKFDGAGRLKPDALGGDRDDREYITKATVPWRTVWIAIEVKESWADALRQACTYARSMLEVGNKWFSLVLVYNQREGALRFCFATRHGLFVSPSWTLSVRADFNLAASALVHACYAPTAEAGLDEHRVLSDKGKLFFNLPGIGTFKSQEEIFARMSLCGRSTHVYRIRPADLPMLAAKPLQLKDPKNLVPKLAFDAEASTFQGSGDLSRAPRPVTRAYAKRPLGLAKAAASKSGMAQPAPVKKRGLAARTALLAVPEEDNFEDIAPAPPIDKPAHTDALATWIKHCKHATAVWLSKDPASSFKELVLKDIWVPLDRLDTEIKILKAMSGRYAFVRCVGYVTLPHQGMELLAHFAPRQKRKGRKAMWQCQDWVHVYPDDEEPKFDPRVHRGIIYETVGVPLPSIAGDPWSVAQSAKDIITALYILYMNGYLHRDVALGNMLPLDKLIENTPAVVQELRELFKDPRFDELGDLFKYQRSVLCDFDQAIEWARDRKLRPHRSGTGAFMATSRSTAWVLKQPYIETLFDDLESVTWGHFYAILRRVIEALKVELEKKVVGDKEAHFEAAFAELEARHYETFNGDDAYFLTSVKEWIMKYGSSCKEIDAEALQATWPLWRRLFRVANEAREIADDLKQDLINEGKTNFGKASPELRLKLDAACKDVVLRYLKAIHGAIEDHYADMKPGGNNANTTTRRDDPENPAL